MSNSKETAPAARPSASFTCRTRDGGFSNSSAVGSRKPGRLRTARRHHGATPTRNEGGAGGSFHRRWIRWQEAWRMKSTTSSRPSSDSRNWSLGCETLGRIGRNRPVLQHHPRMRHRVRPKSLPSCCTFASARRGKAMLRPAGDRGTGRLGPAVPNPAERGGTDFPTLTSRRPGFRPIPGQIKQVIINLIINSLQAFDG